MYYKMTPPPPHVNMANSRCMKYLLEKSQGMYCQQLVLDTRSICCLSKCKTDMPLGEILVKKAKDPFQYSITIFDSTMQCLEPPKSHTDKMKKVLKIIHYLKKNILELYIL